MLLGGHKHQLRPLGWRFGAQALVSHGPCGSEQCLGTLNIGGRERDVTRSQRTKKLYLGELVCARYDPLDFGIEDLDPGWPVRDQ